MFYFNNISSNNTFLGNVFNRYFIYICITLIFYFLLVLLNFPDEIYLDKIRLRNMSHRYVLFNYVSLNEIYLDKICLKKYFTYLCNVKHIKRTNANFAISYSLVQSHLIKKKKAHRNQVTRCLW